MRINKYLADCGVCSRRAADKLIEEGKVSINQVPARLGDEVNDSDVVLVDGSVVERATTFEYLMMNKPKGYVCTVKDDKGRKTVMDLLPPSFHRLVPVGRLDYDSEGLLLFTNDGDLTYKLTHPKNHVLKTYLVKTDAFLTDETVKRLQNGVLIDGKMTNRCHIKVIERGKQGTKIHISISEGRNRQVRKMLSAVNAEVSFLKRIKIGDLQLTGLNRGEVRCLTKQEVDYLKNL